jgi:3-oxoacyl-[acyl-carrier protein] reductase
MKRLANKSALITGGARGIGAATALLFADEGARVGIMDLHREGLDTMAARAREGDLELRAFQGDVSSPQEVERVMAAFVAAYGGIDVLVNNAGILFPKPFLEKTAEEWMRTLAVDLVGVFLCAQAAARHMLRAGSGKIVNISSIRGVDHCGREGVMDYSAAKGAVINLTKTLAKELAPRINVNAVAPGHTDTHLIQGLPEEVRQAMVAGTYLQRFAQPEDIAHAILFLASAEADFITGQVLVVDGGFSLK